MWSPYEKCQNIVQEEWSTYGERSWENPMNHFQMAAKISLSQLKLW